MVSYTIKRVGKMHTEPFSRAKSNYESATYQIPCNTSEINSGTQKKQMPHFPHAYQLQLLQFAPGVS